MANLSNINNILRVSSSGVGLNKNNTGPSELDIESAGADMIDITRTGLKTYRFAISGTSTFSIFDVAANDDRFVIDTSGKVGIGTNSPDSKLSIGTGNNNFRIDFADERAFVGYNTSYGSSGAAFIDGGAALNKDIILNPVSTGNVGIGETSPTSKLHVKDTPAATSGAILTLRNSQATASNTTFGGVFFNSAPGYDFSIGKSNVNSTTTLSFRNGNSGASLMDIDATGNVGIGSTSPSAKLQINDATAPKARFLDTTDFYYTDYGRDGIDAYTNTNSSAPIFFKTGGTERMRIDSSGKVLINQTSDLTSTGTLQVNGMVDITDVTKAIRVYDGTTFVGGTGSGQWAFSSTYANDYSLYAQNDLLFHAGTGNSIDMMIDGGTHNVGIGTTSPAHNLDIESTNPTLILTHSGAVNQANSGRILFAEGPAYSQGHFEIKYDGAVNRLQFNSPIDSTTNLMNIGRDGNVGIGTTSPSYKLHVESADDILALFKSTDNKGAIRISDNDTNAYVSAENGLASFGHNIGANTGNININSSGNVGIGTTSPSRELDVENSSDNAIISAVSNQSYIAGLVLGDTADDDKGGILYNNTSDYLYFLSNGSERMRIASNGNVGIGTTSPTYTFHVASSNNVSIFEDTSGSSGATFCLFNAPSVFAMGSITRNGSATSVLFNTSSDYRLKEDLQDFNALDLVDNITAYDYKWKNTEQRDYGFVAHELQKVMPNVVTGEKDGERMQSVDYSKLTPVLLKAIQELKAEIETLKSQINN